MNIIVVLLSLISFTVHNEIAFIDITETISPTQFEKIQKTILEKGDKQTYSSYYFNPNPHCLIDGIDIYLNPSNQRSSYINGITVYEWKNENFKSYTIKLVRKGDLDNPNIYSPKGMKENRVYLMDYDGYLKSEFEKILTHLKAVKAKFNSKGCDCIRKKPWTESGQKFIN